MRDRAENIVGVIGVATDVSERHRAEDALRDSKEILRSTIESTADGILVVNNSGGVVYANQRFVEMWHIPEHLLATRDDDTLLAFVLSQLIQPHAFITKVKELYATAAEDLDTLDFKDGRSFERYSRPLILEDAIAGRVWSFRDITERKRAERDLAEQARRDSLTGLLNRRAGLAAVEEQIIAARRDSKRLALFVLDVDKFKLINDRHSHEVGDNALIRLATVLTELFGGRGSICRLGGDEFEIAVDHIAIDEAVRLAELLRTQLHGSLTSVELEPLPEFTVSIGIACYPEDGDSAVELVRRADESMYASKAAGGDATRTWRALRRERAA